MTTPDKSPRLILASRSPRRIQLMRESGYAFDVIPADTDEIIQPGWPLYEIPVYLAAEKAEAVYSQLPGTDHIILAADTVVLCDGQVLGKPEDRAHAHSILRMLAGRPHEVVTGIVLKGATEVSGSARTVVHMLPMTDAEISYYLDKWEPWDKAGAYGAQEWIGHCKIDRIDGSFTNVIGLPMHLVYAHLGMPG